jgi:predicted TIM-barrel enzyme
MREAAGDAPVYLGSGLVPDDVDRLVPLVDGAIVGTWFKAGGDVSAPVDGERVRELAERVAGRFRSR